METGSLLPRVLQHLRPHDFARGHTRFQWHVDRVEVTVLPVAGLCKVLANSHAVFAAFFYDFRVIVTIEEREGESDGVVTAYCCFQCCAESS